MKTQACSLLAAFAFALPAFAQTEGKEVKPAANTEKLWKIEVSGISG